MSNVNEAYINALLADAEYAINGQGENDLLLELSERMTPALAEFVNDNFTVVTHVESASGFDSTVWRSDTGQIYVSMRGTEEIDDLISDIDLTISGLARDQIVDMVNWWLKNSTSIGNSAQQISLVGGLFSWGVPVVGTGVLSNITNVIVNGHSLGGHLATAFSRLFGGKLTIDHTYTYNSAGFNPASELFFSNLEFILGEISTGEFPSNSQQTNFFADNGINVTTQDLFNGQVGNRIPIFNEEGVGFPNHYQYKLTDALALSVIVSTLDNRFGFKELSDLFESISNKSERSLEKVLDILGVILNGSPLPDTPISDDAESEGRKVYHSNLFNLRSLLFIDPKSLTPVLKDEYKNLQIVDVETLAYSSKNNDEAGYAYRYSLDNMIPFAIIGGKNLYEAFNNNGSLNAENFSEQYLTDRAAMLNWFTKFNEEDIDYGDKITTNDIKGNFIFTDLASSINSFKDLVLQIDGIGGELPYQHFKFGTEYDDGILGADNDDLI